MKKSNTEIALRSDGRMSFVYDVGDTLVIEHQLPFLTGFTYLVHGERVISVNTKLRKEERTKSSGGTSSRGC